MNEVTHNYYNCFTALWILFATTQVSQYQKKHSPNHIYHGHQWSLICFLHLLWSMASSMFNLCAWQSFSTICPQVFFGLWLSGFCRGCVNPVTVHLFLLKCHVIFLLYGPGLTSMQHTTSHTTAVQSPSHYQWYILIVKQRYQLSEFNPIYLHLCIQYRLLDSRNLYKQMTSSLCTCHLLYHYISCVPTSDN